MSEKTQTELEPSLSVAQCAVLLGKLRGNGKPLHPNSVYRYVRRGMPCRKNFGTTLFRESEVLKWDASKKQGIFL